VARSIRQDKVRELQRTLYRAAKADPGRRFRALYDSVLFTGIAWQHLPLELGCSPAIAHRRLKEWQAAGVFPRCTASSRVG
jgi:RNA-directed DNA polymerase